MVPRRLTSRPSRRATIIGTSITGRRVQALPPLGAARADDRWRGFDGRHAWGRYAGIVLAGSLIAHAAAIVAALLWVRRDLPAPQPIPVELVQEPAPPKPVEPPKPPAPAPPKPTSPEAAPPKPAPAPEPPRTPPAPKPPQPGADAQRAALERELASLKAEQEALKQPPAEKAAEGKAARALLDSIQGLALPSVAADGDIVVGYKTLVFSELAKAKQGFPPGTADGVAGITFAVDADGVLRDLKVAVSSGNRSLDEEAEAIVRHASPFPRPPEGAQRSFSVNVSFAVPAR